MAKKKAAKKGPIKKRKTVKRVKKVWRIFRFGERFELADDVRWCRINPLKYIRDYVGSGQDDEAIEYKKQIAMLRCQPDRHLLQSVFFELREMAANMSRAYRGYLLDVNKQPSSNKDIGMLIGLSEKETTTVLKRLEQIGLIEKVPLPKFDLSQNEKPKNDGSGSEKKAAKKAKKSATGRKGQTGGKQGNGAGNPDNSSAHEKKREPFKKTKTEKVTKNGNGKSKGKENVTEKGTKTKEPTKREQAAIAEMKMIAEKLRKEQENRQKNRDAQEPSGGETSATPSSTPYPLYPTQSEAGGGLPRRNTPGNTTGSVFDNSTARDDPGGGGYRHIIPAAKFWDPTCLSFAYAICMAIELPTSQEPVWDHNIGAYATVWNQNMGAFASLWTNAQLVLRTPAKLETLWLRSIRAAEKLAGQRRRKYKFTNSPEAVFTFGFKRRVISLKNLAKAG